MEINIKVEDYFSREEIKNIAEQELRNSFKNQLAKEANIERILSNLSYEYIFRIIEEELNIHKDEFKAKLKERISKTLDDTNTLRFEIFKRKDAWDRTESPAVKYLDEALANSRDKIIAEVNKRIEEYPFHELRENILDTIYDCIANMLAQKKEE